MKKAISIILAICAVLSTVILGASATAVLEGDKNEAVLDVLDEIEIEEPLIPISSAPDTGDGAVAIIILSVVSILFAVISFRKRETDED